MYVCVCVSVCEYVSVCVCEYVCACVVCELSKVGLHLSFSCDQMMSVQTHAAIQE